MVRDSNEEPTVGISRNAMRPSMPTWIAFPREARSLSPATRARL